MQVFTPMQFAQAFVMCVAQHVYYIDVLAIAKYVYSELQAQGLADPGTLQSLAAKVSACRAQPLLEFT